MESRTPTPIPSCNQSIIVGELVQLPEVTEWPSGDSVVSFSITVRTEGAKTTSVPLSWVNPPKKVFRWKEGDGVIAIGSVVRRFYFGGGGTRSRTDVAVTHAENLSQAKRSSSILDRALEPLQSLAQVLAPA